MATAVAKNYFLFMISIRCAYTGVCIKVKKKDQNQKKRKKDNMDMEQRNAQDKLNFHYKMNNS